MKVGPYTLTALAATSFAHTRTVRELPLKIAPETVMTRSFKLNSIPCVVLQSSEGRERRNASIAWLTRVLIGWEEHRHATMLSCNELPQTSSVSCCVRCGTAHVNEGRHRAWHAHVKEGWVAIVPGKALR